MFFIPRKNAFLDQAFLCSQKEINIILQQDFHQLRLKICLKILTEVELFAFLAFVFLYYYILFPKKQ